MLVDHFESSLQAEKVWVTYTNKLSFRYDIRFDSQVRLQTTCVTFEAKKHTFIFPGQTFDDVRVTCY